MIVEIATLRIADGAGPAFEDAVRRAGVLFERAQGCRSFRLERSIERPSTYRLVVGWDRLEDHTETFRASADFQAWRALVGPYFAEPPQVEHVAVVVEGFAPAVP